MDIGIGLPTQVPDVAGRVLVDWAVQAEQAGFSSLGTVGAQETIRFYYAWLGDIAEQIVAGAATSAEMIKGYAAGFAEAGCDELIFAPGSASLDQITLLAEAIA
jgi:hypothetical protein